MFPTADVICNDIHPVLSPNYFTARVHREAWYTAHTSINSPACMHNNITIVTVNYNMTSRWETVRIAAH